MASSSTPLSIWSRQPLAWPLSLVAIGALVPGEAATPGPKRLSGPFEFLVLAPVLSEAPISAEAAGLRAGVPRNSRVLSGGAYDTGAPGIADRIDPNQPVVKSGGRPWLHVLQSFRSQPNWLALTPDAPREHQLALAAT